MIRKFLLAGSVLAGLAMAADPAVGQAKKMMAEKKYDEAITQLEAAYKKQPAADVKAALAEVQLAKGDSFMNDDAAPPRTKYPTALRAYREVLKYDKDNKKAKDNIATIEGIYKSMGRPVPQ